MLLAVLVKIKNYVVISHYYRSTLVTTMLLELFFAVTDKGILLPGRIFGRHLEVELSLSHAEG